MSQYENQLVPYTSVDYHQGDLKANEVSIQLKKITNNSTNILSDSVTFIYMVKGQAELVINGEATSFKAGQLVLLMSYHVYRLTKSKEVESEYYECQLSMALLLLSKTSKQSYLSSLEELDKGVPIVSLALEEQQEILGLFEKLSKEMNSHSTWGQDVLVLHCITGVVYLFLKEIRQRNLKLKERPVNSSWKILQYIHFHHQKQLTVAEVAAAFGISQSEVKEAVKELTGLSFFQNLNRVRIINSAALLQYNGLSINQIGRIVGFKSDAQYYKEFKQAKKCTPQVFRDSYYPKGVVEYREETKDILIYLYDNFKEELSLVELSKALTISPKKIRHLLAEDLGLSYSDLLISLRQTLAKGLILETGLPLSEIAEIIGYKDQKKFRNDFKEKNGVAPSLLRK